MFLLIRGSILKPALLNTPLYPDMNIRTLHQTLTARLKRAGIESASLDSRLLIQHILKISHEAYWLQQNDPLPPELIKAVEMLVEERAKGRPVSNIIGEKEFYGERFIVSDAVLDPRPDTELLIERILKHYPDQESALDGADLGTGSGCLAVTLARLYPNSQWRASDISSAALAVARKNIERFSVENRVELAQGSWFEAPAHQDQRYDLIISNPPYIPAAAINDLALEVKAHDPTKALSGGVDGLDCYREILATAADYLKNHGRLFFEIGAGQAEAIIQINREINKDQISHKETTTDLAGHERCLLFQKSNTSSA